MDLFMWSKGHLDKASEEPIYDQNSITIYNLDQKTNFTTGRLQLTSHRLIWHHTLDPNCKVEIDLNLIVNTELKQAHSENTNNSQGNQRFNRTYFTRLVLRLDTEWKDFCQLSVVDPSLNRSMVDPPFVQFEFEYGGHNEFFDQLNQQLERKKWAQSLKGNEIETVIVH